MNPAKILSTAQATLVQRGHDRDAPNGERSMAHAVAIFKAVTGIELSEQEGWIFMLALKQARMMRGKPSMDNYVDLAGYTALLGECALKSRMVDDDSAEVTSIAGK